MNITRLGLAIAVASATALLTAGSASAAPSGDPNEVRTATPANACAAIPATLAQFGITPAGFDYETCVRLLAGRVPNVAFGSPYGQCQALETGVTTPGGFFQITYPYTFHAEDGDPFPNLRAHTREQCARALYTFHTIESSLGK